VKPKDGWLVWLRWKADADYAHRPSPPEVVDGGPWLGPSLDRWLGRIVAGSEVWREKLLAVLDAEG
jgi:hypothetical protein